MFTTDYLLTDTSQKVLRLSENLAHEYSQGSYGPAHLLWAVMDEDVGLHQTLQQIGADPSSIRQWALSHVSKKSKSIKYVDMPKANEKGAKVLMETQKLCLRYGESEITPLAILEALITPEVGFDQASLRRLSIALYEIIEWRGKNVNPHLADENGASNGAPTTGKSNEVSGASGQQILEKYCDNINKMGSEGRIDPVLGRDKEMKQLMEILGKRLSPNVLIVGEPGVGKTSIVGGLALKILDGKVPDKLKSATIFSLDVSGRLVAGAFKGEVEERLKSIIKAIKGHADKAILFIDEIHILLDEKGPVGSGVVNLLKPELARGEITVMGATTQAEYQKYIEKDSAFNRRFSRLTIMEPDEIVACQMLQGLVAKYEEFHGMKVEKESITTAVSLSKKYIRDKF